MTALDASGGKRRMRRMMWAAVPLTVVVMGCGDGDLGKCGEVACAANQRCDQSVKVCVLDEAPVVSVVGPSTVVAARTVRLTGTVKDDVAVVLVEASGDGLVWSPVSFDAQGAFETEVALPDADSTTVAVQVRAKDGVGQVTVSATNITVDNAKPMCTIDFAEATNLKGATMVPVTYADGSGLPVSAEALVDGVPIGMLAITEGRGSFAWTVPASEGASAVLTFRATDQHGNTCEVTKTVRVDTVPPTVAFLAPDAGALLGSKFFAASKIKVQTNDGPMGSVAKVVIDVGTGPVEATKAGDSAWEASVTPPANLNDEPAKLTAKAFDVAGNEGTTERSVRIDTTPPTVEFVGPAENTLLGPSFFGTTGGKVELKVTDGYSIKFDPGDGSDAPVTKTGATYAATFLDPKLDFKERVTKSVVLDAAGNEATTTRKFRIDTVAPTVAFTAPMANARLGLSAFASGNDVPVAFTLTDGDSAAKLYRNGTPVASPYALATNATDDGATYSVAFEARDTAGNVKNASHTFIVDRVRPTVQTVSPAAGARSVQTLVVTFSEPMTATTNVVTVSPASAVNGRWSSPVNYAVDGFPPDAVVTASFGNAKDLAGNEMTSAPAPVKFHTRPAFPGNGAVIATNVSEFSVASDVDGVMTVATMGFSISPTTVDLLRMDPKTGQFGVARQATRNSAAFRVHAYSWAMPRPDLTAERTHAMYVRFSSPTNGPELYDTVHFDPSVTSAPNFAGALAFVPAPAIAGEASAERYAGLFSQGYVRGASTTSMSVSDVTQVGIAPEGFTFFNTNVSPVQAATFRCHQTILNQVECITESWSLANSTSASELSIGSQSPCALYAYNRTGGRALRSIYTPYRDCRGGGSESCLLPFGFTEDALPELRVASTANPQRFFGAWRENGNLQLGVRVLDGRCGGGSWTKLGSPVSASSTRFEPVNLGGEPGLLVLQSGVLTLYRP